MNKNEIYSVIITFLSKYDPSKIGVFGYYARNENTEESDIDILVNFKKKIDYFEFVEIELVLSEMLGKRVDLVAERSINPKLKPYIYKDLRIIFQ
ncbi:MAG: nucleotidyltransferase family protein [Candidatus Cloacimonetes bacterium]|nr:nucleotidyltransferase family protein [Candidatus Cloacimonadota bacterium]